MFPGMDGRPDLAAMITVLGRGLIAMEQPVLREHDLTMWAYAVLLRLDEAPLRTQAALARSIGADKTRLIGVLDDLQERGLIQREADPNDRRVHLLSLTERGRALRESTQRGIRQRETRLLARLPATQRRAFLHALHALYSLPPEEVSGAEKV
jgi:DNA-binding MarR family transcriptional regulator